MKKILFLLALLPTMLLAQTDSWVRFAVQYDYYAPQESNFFMVEDTISGDTVMFHQPTVPYEVLDTVVNINSGSYVVTLTDSWGDGWISNSPAWFKMMNDCQGLIINYDPLTQMFFTLDTLVNILPCAPPTSGCIDPLATNFDSLASIDDGSCTYIYGCNNPFASNYDSTAAFLPEGPIVPGGSCNLTSWNQNYFGIDSLDYFADTSLWDIGSKVIIGNNTFYVDLVSEYQGNCNNPAVLVYVCYTPQECDGQLGTFSPGLNVNAIVGEYWTVDPCEFIFGCTDPTALNYDPTAGVDNGTCIHIPGCMDSTSINYNPAATQDDGSCGGGGISCSPGKEVLTVQIMFDQYAGEIGWNLVDGGGTLIEEQPIGTYSSQPMGAIVTQQICIDYGTQVQFTIEDSYGDGLGGSIWGGIDGNWVVYTACDTISEGSGNFGPINVQAGMVNECTTPDIFGCTDPGYVEYNPMANIDDSSCVTPHVFGCVDSTAFNYDPLATSQLLNGGCDNQLILTDWAGNGWAGSFLVVTQGTNWWGPFTVEDDSSNFETTINLNTQEKVKVYFYTFGQSAQTSDQCMFEIINPAGTTVLAGGTNSFTDPMLSYNQYGFIYQGDALCGTNCIPSVYGCTDSLAVNYDPLANTTDNSCYYLPGCTDPAYEEYHTQGFVADYDDGSCTTYAIFGCMDSTMFNYDQYATVQWTSVVDQTDPCIAKIFGCLDPTAFNYDPNANTEDYSCVPFIYGCMDNTMFNYDPSANIEYTPSNCEPIALGCTDSTATNFDPLANTNDGTCIPYLYGCTDSTAINYNPLANTDDNTCIATVLGCTDSTSLNYDSLANVDDGTCIPYIYGCTDASQYNYDPLANTDDGTCVPYIYGCTDPTMFNYDATANSDNGSCFPYVYGCTDTTMFNYDPLANTDNNSCIPYIYGCTDSTALNYNPLANTTDNSCIQFIYGCTDSTAINYNSLANTDDGTCILPIYGCTDSTMYNYDASANTDDGTCVPYIYGCMDPTMFNYDPTVNTDDGTCVAYIYGCTDPTMFNYDATANTDNGSCEPFVYGCTDSTMYNYDPLANTDNSSCIPFVYGCTDSTAFNYNNLANTDDNSCIPVLNGCTDSTALNFNPLANTDDNSCIPYLYGCTDSLAMNYNSLANTDDGTCVYYIYGCTDSTMYNYDPLANTDDGTCIPYIYGCTDPTMFNYDPTANSDDGTCVPYIYGCTDPTMFNYDPTANSDNGSCVPFIYGCTDSTMWNYDPTANTDNGTCIAYVYGCTDNTALNFNPLANTLDNSCCYISGCTDSTALNYDPNACYDDNSCITIVTGCTDVGAYNYDPLANVSDSTACLYDAGCYGGPGIPYWLNDGCYAWVIDVDNYCCTNDWDASCQSMYDYCQQGWPTGLDDISSIGIVVYPNPSKDLINIETRLEVEIEIYDMVGRKVLYSNESKGYTIRLDVSDLRPGAYNMIIIHNDKRYSKTIVKQ